MPEDADKWKQDMIDKGLMKDDDGYYHYTVKEEDVTYMALLENAREELLGRLEMGC